MGAERIHTCSHYIDVLTLYVVRAPRACGFEGTVSHKLAWLCGKEPARALRHCFTLADLNVDTCEKSRWRAGIPLPGSCGSSRAPLAPKQPLQMSLALARCSARAPGGM